MTLLYYILVFGLLAAFGGSVVWGLWWAVRGGQLANFQRSAASIFDAEEHIGRPTDAFPRNKNADHE